MTDSTMAQMAQGLPDILAPGLQVVFCGLNPGARANSSLPTWSARCVGRATAAVRPSPNASTPASSCGATWCGVKPARCSTGQKRLPRPTQRADQVGKEEFARAAAGLARKLALLQPQWIAFLGKAAFAAMTGQRQVEWGEQTRRFGGARVWILPNPSGLNRGYSKEQLVQAYAELRRAIV